MQCVWRRQILYANALAHGWGLRWRGAQRRQLRRPRGEVETAQSSGEHCEGDVELAELGDRPHAERVRYHRVRGVTAAVGRGYTRCHEPADK